MLVGYARVSTKYQSLDTQLDELKLTGCEEIFTDRVSVSGAKHRDGLEKCLNYIRDGDTLIVCKIDCLGRSIGHLVKLLNELHQNGISFYSLEEAIDTRPPTGDTLVAALAALVRMDYNLNAERTRAGLAGLEAARKCGSKPGIKPIITGDVETAVLERHRRGNTIPEIAKATNLSRATVYRYFQKHAENNDNQQPQD